MTKALSYTPGVFLAILIALCLMPLSTVSGGVLDGNGDAVMFASYSGSQDFNNTSSGLEGTLDYAVFTADEFAIAFPSASWSPGGPVVYAYQLENTGDVNISAEIVGVSNPVTVPHDIDSFEYNVGEQAPSSALFGPTSANWSFVDPDELDPGQTSQILVFSSPNIPMAGGSLIVDGGTFATLTEIPTPSSTPIPEPTSVALLFAASLLFFAAGRRG